MSAEVHAPLKLKFELQLESQCNQCLYAVSIELSSVSFLQIAYVYICLILTVVMKIRCDQKCDICEYEFGLFKWYFIRTNFALLLMLT